VYDAYLPFIVPENGDFETYKFFGVGGHILIT
jgi:hypothetical protein